jgi:hypothetical protein
MTVLEWLDSSSRYTFKASTLEKVALDRECDPNADAYSDEVTTKQKDLMSADLIVEAVIFSPSSTASLSQSHNGFQRSVGSEQDTYRKDKLDYALGIYKKYGDEKAEILEGIKAKIRFIPIEDVDSL